MAAAAAAAGAPSATAAASQDPMNALRSAALRRSTQQWSAAAAAASFFSPPFRCRCRCRRAYPEIPREFQGQSEAPGRDGAQRPLARLPLALPADDIAGADAAPNGWAIGVDPDTGGAIAILSPDGSSQVFDNPFAHIVVSEVIRKRLDTESIIQLLRGLDAPPGMVEYGFFIWLMDRFSSSI